MRDLSYLELLRRARDEDQHGTEHAQERLRSVEELALANGSDAFTDLIFSIAHHGINLVDILRGSSCMACLSLCFLLYE